MSVVTKIPTAEIRARVETWLADELGRMDSEIQFVGERALNTADPRTRDISRQEKAQLLPRRRVVAEVLTAVRRGQLPPIRSGGLPPALAMKRVLAHVGEDLSTLERRGALKGEHSTVHDIEQAVAELRAGGGIGGPDEQPAAAEACPGSAEVPARTQADSSNMNTKAWLKRQRG